MNIVPEFLKSAAASIQNLASNLSKSWGWKNTDLPPSPSRPNVSVTTSPEEKVQAEKMSLKGISGSSSKGNWFSRLFTRTNVKPKMPQNPQEPVPQGERKGIELSLDGGNGRKTEKEENIKKGSPSYAPGIDYYYGKSRDLVEKEVSNVIDTIDETEKKQLNNLDLMQDAIVAYLGGHDMSPLPGTSEMRIYKQFIADLQIGFPNPQADSSTLKDLIAYLAVQQDKRMMSSLVDKLNASDGKPLSLAQNVINVFKEGSISTGDEVAVMTKLIKDKSNDVHLVIQELDEALKNDDSLSKETKGILASNMALALSTKHGKNRIEVEGISKPTTEYWKELSKQGPKAYG